MAFILRDDQEVVLTPKPIDKRGNPVGLDTIDDETFEVTSSNPEILTATLQTDNTILVTPVGPLGTSQASVKMTIPATGQEVIGTLDVEVVGGAAVSLTIEPGTPTDLP